MNPKVVKLREEREKNVTKIASLQARNQKIDGMDICTAFFDLDIRKTPPQRCFSFIVVLLNQFPKQPMGTTYTPSCRR